MLISVTTNCHICRQEKEKSVLVDQRKRSLELQESSGSDFKRLTDHFILTASAQGAQQGEMNQMKDEIISLKTQFSSLETTVNTGIQSILDKINKV